MFTAPVSTIIVLLNVNTLLYMPSPSCRQLELNVAYPDTPQTSPPPKALLCPFCVLLKVSVLTPPLHSTFIELPVTLDSLPKDRTCPEDFICSRYGFLQSHRKPSPLPHFSMKIGKSNVYVASLPCS